MHDKATGYFSFFAIIIFWWAATNDHEKKKKTKKVKNTFVTVLNWLLGLSIAAFALTLIYFK